MAKSKAGAIDRIEWLEGKIARNEGFLAETHNDADELFREACESGNEKVIRRYGNVRWMIGALEQSMADWRSEVKALRSLHGL